MVLWSEGATAIAPIDEISCLSKSGVQFAPPSTVFQTPPATAPKYQVFGSPGTPSMAKARPPRKGPTCRHCMPLKSFASTCGIGLAEGLGAAWIRPTEAKQQQPKRRTEKREIILHRLRELLIPFNCKTLATSRP